MEERDRAERRGEAPRRPGLSPPELPERWLHARREETLVRWAKRAGLLVGLVVVTLLALNWWIVSAYLTGREQAVAAACQDTPFADGAVIEAGGPDAITEPDAEVLAAYRADPDARATAARRIRDRASLLDDRRLASAATEVMLQGPFQGRAAIAEVETACRRYLERYGGD